MPEIGIVTVNFGATRLIEQALAPFEGDMGIRSYVVDNFKSTDEQELVAKVGAERGWSVMLNDKNSGFGRGVNIGMQAAFRDGASHVLLLNPDAHITRDALLAMTAASSTFELVSPRILQGDRTVWFEELPSAS